MKQRAGAGLHGAQRDRLLDRDAARHVYEHAGAVFSRVVEQREDVVRRDDRAEVPAQELAVLACRLGHRGDDHAFGQGLRVAELEQRIRWPLDGRVAARTAYRLVLRQIEASEVGEFPAWTAL